MSWRTRATARMALPCLALAVLLADRAHHGPGDPARAGGPRLRGRPPLSG
jgi:hypothetical protein